MKILLVEPNYRSTFPPLGLLRISAFFKSIGITPKFVRGLCKEATRTTWDKIYVSSLFTFELPRTIKTINFYRDSVNDPGNDIVVGGVGATLMPEYIKSNSVCKVIAGCLLEENMLGFNEPPIASFTPDYDLLKDVDKKYVPNDAYFTRVTSGCIRKCAFCAVPVLEPKFFYLQSLRSQIDAVDQMYGQKHDLVILDNNILALENIQEILSEIKELGFQKDSKMQNRKRFVDFNQGIDVRLITPEIARSLSQINVYPVRIAFDHISVEKSYREGVANLAEHGIRNIMTYVMFNFKDTPEDFYKRLRINIELSKEYDIRITGFPMRFCPIDDVNRHYISKKWNWRYLRGIQCILNATHGVVSPRSDFFDLAFGKDFEEFVEIVSMPDDYIIYRKKYKNQADEWRSIFLSLNINERNTLYSILEKNHDEKQKVRTEDLKLSEILKYY